MGVPERVRAKQSVARCARLLGCCDGRGRPASLIQDECERASEPLGSQMISADSKHPIWAWSLAVPSSRSIEAAVSAGFKPGFRTAAVWSGLSVNR